MPKSQNLGLFCDKNNSGSFGYGCTSTPERYILMAQRLGRRTFDQAVVGSIPGRGRRGVGHPRSTQPSIPPGYVNRIPALLAGVKAGCARFCLAASKIV